VRAEGQGKVTREYKEGDESVTVPESAQQKPAKMNPDGTFYIDEVPVRYRHPVHPKRLDVEAEPHPLQEVRE
jgi:hypothetical protein